MGQNYGVDRRLGPAQASAEEDLAGTGTVPIGSSAKEAAAMGDRDLRRRVTAEPESAEGSSKSCCYKPARLRHTCTSGARSFNVKRSRYMVHGIRGRQPP